MKEVIMQVQSFSADYPKAPIYVDDLVRCKDCLNRDNSCGMGEHKWCRLLKQATSPDDYCSYGKRKTKSEV